MASHIERRKFLATLGGAAAAWPLAARGQLREETYRIGFLGVTSYAQYRHQVDALRTSLRQLGYEEGRNTAMEIIDGPRADTTAFPSWQPSW